MNRHGDIYLSEYQPRSELVVEGHHIRVPKFPAIDVHGHFASLYCGLYSGSHWGKPDIHEVVKVFKQHGIERIVNLDGFWDGFLGLTIDHILESLHPYQDFFITFVSVDTDRVNDSDFNEYVINHLTKAKEKGIKGVKLFKHVSLMVKDDKGSYVPGRNIRIDDPRLKIIWETAGKLELPILIHIGDPVAFFRPVDQYNERYEELLQHPDWSFYKPGLYTFDEMMKMQRNLLSQNPDTTFIVAHVGSYSENLGFVGECLANYPNMYVDIAARINELGRQPYTARKFFTTWQDRILFGTDAFTEDMDWRYPEYFRFLETRDEYFGGGRWRMYGIGLDDQVLEKVYRKNAIKVLSLE